MQRLPTKTSPAKPARIATRAVAARAPKPVSAADSMLIDTLRTAGVSEARIRAKLTTRRAQGPRAADDSGETSIRDLAAQLNRVLDLVEALTVRIEALEKSA